MASTKPSASSSAAEGEFFCERGCDGVVMWMEYDLDESGERTVSTGLMQHDWLNSKKKRPDWSTYHRQAVFFFKNTGIVSEEGVDVYYDVTFKPASGEIVTKFSLE